MRLVPWVLEAYDIIIENVLYSPFLPCSFGFLIPILIHLVIARSPQLVNSSSRFICIVFFDCVVLDCFIDVPLPGPVCNIFVVHT